MTDPIRSRPRHARSEPTHERTAPRCDRAESPGRGDRPSWSYCRVVTAVARCRMAAAASCREPRCGRAARRVQREAGSSLSRDRRALASKGIVAQRADVPAARRATPSRRASSSRAPTCSRPGCPTISCLRSSRRVPTSSTTTSRSRRASPLDAWSRRVVGQETGVSEAEMLDLVLHGAPKFEAAAPLSSAAPTTGRSRASCSRRRTRSRRARSRRRSSSMMLDQFDEEITSRRPVAMRGSATSTVYDVVTIASILERETKLPQRVPLSPRSSTTGSSSDAPAARLHGVLRAARGHEGAHARPTSRRDTRRTRTAAAGLPLDAHLQSRIKAIQAAAKPKTTDTSTTC